MESTGKYWIPVYNVLETAMDEVRVCNPKWLSLVKGEKDDNKDAARIWSYVKKTDTDFRESADTANSTKDFLRFLP